MTQPTAPRPYCFNQATGKLPARIWQALSNAQHDARHNGIPIVVVKEGLRRFAIVDIDDWGDLFIPSPETPPDRDERATHKQRACQSSRNPCDTLIQAFRLTMTGTPSPAAPVHNVQKRPYLYPADREAN